MRVLVSSTGGDGHVLPLLPLAAAFRSRGDDVAFAAPTNQRARVEHAQLEFLRVGPEPTELATEIASHVERVAKLPIAERRGFAFSGRFGRIEAPRRLEPLREAISSWTPDLVVYESADLAAPIAATEARIPCAHHAFGRPIPERALRMAAELVAPLWRAAGLEPDPLAGAYRSWYIDICPPSLQAPLPQTPQRTLYLRPTDARRLTDDRPRDRRVVYATLGTIVNQLPTFRLLLDALEHVECQIVMTVGRNRDPRDLDPIPRNATVARYIPQHEILSACDAVVAHGGSGSTLGALAHARPLVLLPQAADQFDNADACAAVGVAEVIGPAERSVERIRAAVQTVLADASYSTVARAIATEIAAMPDAATVANTLARGTTAPR